jgi:hypothetical protein
MELMPGVTLGQRSLPIARVGAYVFAVMTVATPIVGLNEARGGGSSRIHGATDLRRDLAPRHEVDHLNFLSCSVWCLVA